ncbi:G:T-mismatch repair DNA endonuclease (very short patch repair protein) [Burkholderia sp. 572]
MSRDTKNLEALRAAGWSVIIIWECGLRGANAMAHLEWLPDIISRMPDVVYEWPA